MTKIAGRQTTTAGQQARIADIIDKFTKSPELELQQRSVEYENLFQLGEIKYGVLERMPPPELKATVMGIGKDPHFIY